jgi:CRISPR/Cas system-associated exonuclease Cas4 (RecB family)
MLRLQTAPRRPEERLSFLEQGNIVHQVLAAGYAQPETFERLFEEAFEQKREKLNIPNGYHTERLRNAMREDLLLFAGDAGWPRAQFQSETEKPFVFPLDQTLEISGRIDRIDTAADGRAYVIDYKYSAAQRTKGRLKDENLLQAPLYMMAAERAFNQKPDGVFYVGLKAGVEYAGWSRSGILKSLPIPENWLEIAERRTLQAMREIRAGRVEVAPANPASCRFCDCRDICRVTVAAATDAAAEIAEGA